MTSQKTIERCRARVKELEDTTISLSESNRILLDNNAILSNENQKLRKEIEAKSKYASEVETQRKACVLKCETAISEKNRILQEKENYIRSLHGTVWHLKNTFKCKSYGIEETPDGFQLHFEFGNVR